MDKDSYDVCMLVSWLTALLLFAVFISESINEIIKQRDHERTIQLKQFERDVNHAAKQIFDAMKEAK